MKLKLLQDLNISKNLLTSLPEGLTKLRALRRLDVSDNQLSALPEDMGELKNLRHLNASHNALLQLPQVSHHKVLSSRKPLNIALLLATQHFNCWPL